MKQMLFAAALLIGSALDSHAAQINPDAPLCRDRWGLQGLFAARSLGWLATGDRTLADYGCRAAKGGAVQILQRWPQSYVVLVRVDGRDWLTIAPEIR